MKTNQTSLTIYYFGTLKERLWKFIGSKIPLNINSEMLRSIFMNADEYSQGHKDLGLLLHITTMELKDLLFHRLKSKWTNSVSNIWLNRSRKYNTMHCSFHQKPHMFPSCLTVGVVWLRSQTLLFSSFCNKLNFIPDNTLTSCPEHVVTSGFHLEINPLPVLLSQRHLLIKDSDDPTFTWREIYLH